MGLPLPWSIGLKKRELLGPASKADLSIADFRQPSTILRLTSLESHPNTSPSIDLVLVWSLGLPWSIPFYPCIHLLGPFPFIACSSFGCQLLGVRGDPLCKLQPLRHTTEATQPLTPQNCDTIGRRCLSRVSEREPKVATQAPLAPEVLGTGGPLACQAKLTRQAFRKLPPFQNVLGT